MDQVRLSGDEGKIVHLAEYRRRLAPGDNERPPPSPRPAAARRPVPLVSIDVFGSIGGLHHRVGDRLRA